MRQSGEYHSLAFRHGRAAVRTELEVQDDANQARRRRVSSRPAEFEVLGGNNGGADIVVGKFEDSPTGVTRDPVDAQGYSLIFSGPTASVSKAVGDAGDRSCGERLLP